MPSQGPAAFYLRPCAAVCWIWRGCSARYQGTLQAAHSQCILLVPFPSLKPGALAASFSHFPTVWSFLLQQELLLGPAVHSALSLFCSCRSPFVRSQSSPFHRPMVKPMSSLPSASLVAEVEGYFVKFNLLQKEDGRMGENDA